jgi:hypothetical protein
MGRSHGIDLVTWSTRANSKLIIVPLIRRILCHRLVLAPSLVYDLPFEMQNETG